MMAATSAAADAGAGAEWTAAEFADAMRRSAVLSTSTRGIAGVIVGVVESDGGIRHVKLRLPFGTGFIRPQDIVTPPPTRLAAGARVSTPYGRGVVKRCRSTLERIDYEVALVDARLANGPSSVLSRSASEPVVGDAADVPDAVAFSCATGFLSPDAVQPRDHLTAEEALQDAAVVRAQGNDALKAKDYDTAATAYNECLGILSKYRHVGNMIPPRDVIILLKEAGVKALSNLSQALLSRAQGDDLQTVLSCVHQALEIDPSNIAKQHDKLYFRRAMAFMIMKEWQLAIDDLRQPALAANAAAKAKLDEAKKMLKAETDKAKKTWSKAFELHAEEEAKQEAAAPSTTTSAQGSPARLLSPEGRMTVTSTPPGSTSAKSFKHIESTPAASRWAEDSPAAEEFSPDAGSSSTSKRFAGRTPHPRGKWAKRTDEEDDADADEGLTSPGSATATAFADATEEQQETTPWLTYAGYALAGAAVIGGAAALISTFRSRSLRR